VISQDHGARADIIVAGPEEYIDRGGANNLISPENGTSQNCWGMAPVAISWKLKESVWGRWKSGAKNTRELLKRNTTRLQGSASTVGLKAVYRLRGLF